MRVEVLSPAKQANADYWQTRVARGSQPTSEGIDGAFSQGPF